MTAKQLINIIFLLIILVTSLPIKKASQFFIKKQVQEEVCDNCDVPLKKANDSLDFKDYPCCFHHQHQVASALITNLIQAQLSHPNWKLPLWPAVEIHTPPPNFI